MWRQLPWLNVVGLASVFLSLITTWRDAIVWH